MNKRHYQEIIDRGGETLTDKLAALAEEAIESAQQINDIDAAIWYKAVVLFEFSLMFVVIAYPGLNEHRDLILEAFKKEVMRRFPL